MELIVSLSLTSDCRILINLPPFLWSLWCLLCTCSMNWQRCLHSTDQQFFPDAREWMCPIYRDLFLKKIFTNTVKIYAVKAERKYVLGFSKTYRRVGESNGKLPLRTCPGCSVPEPYRSPDWALVPTKSVQGMNTHYYYIRVAKSVCREGDKCSVCLCLVSLEKLIFTC
jgi:hypothetical protein